MLERDPALPLAGRTASWLESIACGLAWLLPFGLALRGSGASPLWAGDLGAVREHRLIVAGTEGVLTTIATQLSGLVPIGDQGARAGLVGALALGAAGALLFTGWCRLLQRRRPSGLNPLLALPGSLLWSLSPPALSAAAGSGSGVVALCLLLLGLRLASAGLAHPRTLPLLGVVLGLCFGESQLAALALLLILVADALWEGSHRELPWGYLVVGFALSAGTCVAVPCLRSWAPGVALDVGLGALPGSLDSVWAQAPASRWHDGVQRVWQGLQEQLGSVARVLALLGLAAAPLQRSVRRAALPWALLGLAGLLVQLADTGLSSSWGSLAAGAGLLAFVPLSLQLGLGWLWSRPVPFARPASVLGLAFSGTLVLHQVERSSVPPVPAVAGMELWTEAALAHLPPQSVLLVENPALGSRLLAAQLLGGVRPDVLTVPLPLLQRGTLRAQLLRREPELAAVLRQVAVQGWADEAALDRLAAARPVFSELDPRWNPRLLARLRPAGLWLALQGRALSSVERRDAVEESQFVLERLRAELVGAGALDAGTRAALAAALRQRALLLAALGDEQLAASTSRELLTLLPGDALGLELARRLEQQGRVTLSGLLRQER